MARPLRAGACAWGLALALTVPLLRPPAASADPADEALVAAQTAAARAPRRLPALTRTVALDAVARAHAARVVATGGPLFHNPALVAQTPGWQAVGEVVGRVQMAPGWDANVIQQFLASPVHRLVLLNPSYNALGVGTARGAGGAVTVVEVLARGTVAARPPAPPRASRRHSVPSPARTPSSPPTQPPLPETTTTAAPSTEALAAVLFPAPGPVRPRPVSDGRLQLCAVALLIVAGARLTVAAKR